MMISVTISKAIRWLVAGYGMLLIVAAGGFAFANLGGLVAGALQFGAAEAPGATVIQTWMHRGWIFGAGVALFGIVMKLRKKRKQRAARGAEDSDRGRRRQVRRRRPQGRRYGRLASTAVGGLGGALLGGMLGGTFVLLWFSITYSPFAPRDWASSVTVARQGTGSIVRKKPAATSDYPVVQLAFGAPLVLGAITGAVFGGVAGVTEVK
jgi:hypothetical protein